MPHSEPSTALHPLLDCHSRSPIDPEREWATSPGLGWSMPDWRGRLVTIGSRLLAASSVLARADRPTDVGWFDLDEPSQPDEPEDGNDRDDREGDDDDPIEADDQELAA